MISTSTLFDSLPNELINEIFRYSDRPTLASLALTDRRFRSIVTTTGPSIQTLANAIIEKPARYQKMPAALQDRLIQDRETIRQILVEKPEALQVLPKDVQSNPEWRKIAYLWAKSRNLPEVCNKLLEEEASKGPLTELDRKLNGFFEGLNDDPRDIRARGLEPSLRDDDLVINAAVSKRGCSIDVASPRLRNSRPIVLTALKTWPFAYVHATDPNIKKDKEAIFSFLSNTSLALLYWDNNIATQQPALCDDKAFMLRLVKRNSCMFQRVSDRLKNDEEVIAALLEDVDYVHLAWGGCTVM